MSRSTAQVGIRQILSCVLHRSGGNLRPLVSSLCTLSSVLSGTNVRFALSGLKPSLLAPYAFNFRLLTSTVRWIGVFDELEGAPDEARLRYSSWMRGVHELGSG